MEPTEYNPIFEFDGTDEFDPFEIIECVEENVDCVPEAPPETEWYHGRLDRAQAEKRLNEHQKLGSYLIRESERKPGAYVLSFLGKTGINHFKMTAVCGAYYIGGREFNSLSLLIGYYTGWSDLLKGERLVYPVPPPEPVYDKKLVKSVVGYIKLPETDELSFMKGEMFMVHNDMGDGWLWVTSTFTNKSGIINQDLTEELGEDDDPVEQHKWYHFDITKDEIAERLAKSGQGSWLVKRSEKTKGDFTIYFYCGGTIHKFKVQKQTIGVYFMGGRCFKSVADVIERYKVEDIMEGYKLATSVLRESCESLSSSSSLSDVTTSNVSSHATLRQSSGSNFFLNRNDTIVMSGHLHRKSHKTKKWRKMYFVLNGTEQQLYYFDNEKRSKPKGLIELSHSFLYPVHESLFGRPNVFQLVSKDLNPESLCYLCSDTSDQAQEWIRKLKEYCINTQPSRTIPPPPHHHHHQQQQQQQQLHHHHSPPSASAPSASSSSSATSQGQGHSPSGRSPSSSLASSSLTRLRSLTIKIFSLNCNVVKLVSHPYCIVSLNEVKACRTQVVSNEKLEKCWDEEFLIEDIPSDIDHFMITVFNKEKMSKDKEIASIKFNLNELEAYNEDKWYNMKFAGVPTKSTDKCSLRVSMCYTYEVIMPASEYVMLKEMLLLEDLEFVQALVNVCNSTSQDRTLLATSLLQLFRHENKEAILIRKFLEMDIDSTESKETLFRRDSFGTSLMSQYMNTVASEFLRKATSDTVNKVMCNKFSSESNQAAEQDREINGLLNELVDNIVASSNYVPHVLKDICYHLILKLANKWPNDITVKRRAISAFFFLRLVCVALTKPRHYNLISESPSPKSHGILVQLANSLIKLANLSDTNRDMVSSEFGPDNRRRIILFLDEISNMPRVISNQPTASVDTARCLATIHQICNSHIEQFTELTKTQPYVKRVITVTELLNTRENFINMMP